MSASIPELKRVLQLPTVAFIAIGFMIGGGVFVFTGIVYKIVGPALPIAYGLAVIPVFVSMMPLAMLGSAIPTTGASYRYPSRMVSPGLAFVGVWVYAWASFFGQVPLYALGCAGYLRTLLPSLAPTPLAIGLVTFFYIVNLLGVKLAARIQGILVLILILAMIYYAYCGTAVIDTANFDRIMQKGPSNVLLGTGLLTFTYLGANGIVELGDEIVNPSRVIPRAFFIALPIVMMLYLSVAIATVGAVPVHVLQYAAEPLIRVAQDTTGKAGFVFFTLGGMIIFLPVMVAAVRLQLLYPEQYKKSDFKLKQFWLWFCPFTGMLLMLFFGTIILLVLKSVWKISCFIAFIASGIMYYQLRKRYLAGKGIQIDELVKEQP